jgi:CheY-like chemotaxis protein
MKTNEGAVRSREVLLIEDSPGDVRRTQEAFRDVNQFVYLHVVNDGVEAMAFLKREGKLTHAPRPDLILLDLNLPKMDGQQVLAQIAAAAELNRLSAWPEAQTKTVKPGGRFPGRGQLTNYREEGDICPRKFFWWKTVRATCA